MTHIPVQLPFKGFTEQTQFSVVPPGMTPSCLNVMPSDVWNGRLRISTRNGTQLYNTGTVQFMSTFRAYIGGTLVEKLIFVRGGIIYYADPNATLPATPVAFPGQSPVRLNTTGLVEGVQFNEYFYFVDGTHYTKVLLTDTTTGVSVWGNATAPHGPYHTDPTSSPAGNRATLICRWGARVVLAGYKQTPNVWFACAPDHVVGTSGLDGWSGTDFIGAVSGIGGTVADDGYGTLGDPIVAIFPFAQTGLMFACTNSFSFLTNDPEYDPSSAQIVALTKSIGITSQRAFCQSQEKGAFILANDGLYFINANDFNFNRASRISAGRLDSFFLRLDFGTPTIGGTSAFSGGTLATLLTSEGSSTGANVYAQTPEGGLSSESTTSKIEVGSSVISLFGGESTGEIFSSLCYDPDREGVWIFLSVSGIEDQSLHLYYDLKTDSFWPQRFADPNCYAPLSGIYVEQSRTKSGRLFMGSPESISIIDRSFPIGIDGWYSAIEDEDQRRQFVRASLTVGPLIGQLPYRIMLNEVRVDLGDDKYELPTGFNDLSSYPILSLTSGDTAQSALGIQTDSLFVVNLNPLVIDGGNAEIPVSPTLYDGGDVTPPTPSKIDGRFAVRPFGQYTKDDPFSSGIARVFNGPSDWIIRWDPAHPTSARWCIEKITSTGPTVYGIEYSQINPDIAGPNGLFSTTHQTPVSPDIRDNADISGAAFSASEVTEIGTLVPGKNTAKKCRKRAEAIYMTIASDGKPWSIERMSVIATQVGKSRGGEHVII
jgi:hypothetical protein